MSNKEIDRLAKDIRRLWCDEVRDLDLRTTGRASGWGSTHMRKWDGGTSPDGRTYSCVWPKIAEFCARENLEADKLVRAMFYGEMTYAPYPNMAYGDKALEKYRVYTQPSTRLEMKMRVLYEFDAQKARAVALVTSLKMYRKLDEQTAWRSTIANKMEPFSPLFRYCIAKNQGWEDIAPTYEAAAKRQYDRCADIYSDVWADWLPTELRKRDV